MTLAVLFAAPLIQGVFAGPIAAANPAELTYNFTLKKGVTNTYLGETLKFTGSGTITVDEESGTFTYSIDLSNGLTFEGTGQMTRTVKDAVFGVATTMSGDREGVVIFSGQFRNGKFKKGKLVVGIPNLLGDGPEGFAYSTATLDSVLGPIW